jgi:hypothetical protein
MIRILPLIDMSSLVIFFITLIIKYFTAKLAFISLMRIYVVIEIFFRIKYLPTLVDFANELLGAVLII